MDTDVMVGNGGAPPVPPVGTRVPRRAPTVNGDVADAADGRAPSVPITEDHRVRLADLADRMHPQDGRSISMAQAAEMALEVGLRHLASARVPTIADMIGERVP